MLTDYFIFSAIGLFVAICSDLLARHIGKHLEEKSLINHTTNATTTETINISKVEKRIVEKRMSRYQIAIISLIAINLLILGAIWANKIDDGREKKANQSLDEKSQTIKG